MGSPHSYTIVITTQIESGFVSEDDLIPFACNLVPLSVPAFQTEGRRIVMAQIDTETRNECAECAWMVDNKSAGVMRAHRMM
ncbi:hypothetical protein TNCV_2500411 [Trichonephila clavipes]|nr:hypothetical protein TNCV_2500411 [Trichonephila clavipes]